MKDRASVVAFAQRALGTVQSMMLDRVVVQQFPEVVRGYWRDALPKVGVKPASPPFPPQWCGAFALACVHGGGLALTVPWVIGKGFLCLLEQTLIPEPGDIAYLAEPFQHHAVVCHEADGVVGTINGNQGVAEPIKYAEHPIAHWTAFYSIAKWLPSENVA